MAKTRGATSFTTITLNDLNGIFANKGVNIPVSRKFLEGLGLTLEKQVNPVISIPIRQNTPILKENNNSEEGVPFTVI